MAVFRILKSTVLIFLILVFFAACASMTGTKSTQGRAYEHDFEKESLEQANHMGI